MKKSITCYFKKDHIQGLLGAIQEISEKQIHKELLKEKTETELHGLQEGEVLLLILQALLKIAANLKKIDSNNKHLKQNMSE